MLFDVAHTRVHAGGYHLHGEGKIPGGPEPQYYSRLDELLDVDLSAYPNGVVEQEAITTEDIKNGVELHGGKLGKGGYGVAFKALFRFRQYPARSVVVKFANDMIQNAIIRFRLTSPDIRVIELSETMLLQHPDEVMRARTSMKTEYENALQILAPMHYAKRVHSLDVSVDGLYRIMEHKTSDFLAIQEEAKELRRHPGYNQLHKIIHFNSDLACLFSEFCDGDLWSFISSKSNVYRTRKRKAPDGLPDERREIALWNMKLNRDIGLAVHYLLDVVHVAHTDIKPENIFYRRTGPNDLDYNYTWILSDYGICDKCTSSYMKVPRGLGGTRVYLPSNFLDWKLGKGNVAFQSDLIMIHCYACTMWEVAMRLYPREITLNRHDALDKSYNSMAGTQQVQDWQQIFPDLAFVMNSTSQVDYRYTGNPNSLVDQMEAHFEDHVNSCRVLVEDCERDFAAMAAGSGP